MCILEDDGITVHCPTQCIDDTQAAVAQVLNFPVQRLITARICVECFRWLIKRDWSFTLLTSGGFRFQLALACRWSEREPTWKYMKCSISLLKHLRHIQPRNKGGLPNYRCPSYPKTMLFGQK